MIGLASDPMVFQNTRFPRRLVSDRVGLIPAAAGDVDETFHVVADRGRVDPGAVPEDDPVVFEPAGDVGLSTLDGPTM